MKLPIDIHLPQILSALQKTNALILRADPGSGKTTRVPPALLNTPLCKHGGVLVLEPRRLAAKLSAERVASEMREQVGETVGYQFRFEKVDSRATRLRYLTEGTFLRRLGGDPELRDTSVVLLDEFHERSLMTDVAFAYLRRLQSTTRPDLRLGILSATLDIQKLQEALPQAEIVDVKAPHHEVKVHYSAASSKDLSATIRSTLRTAIETRRGGVLVFLPGMAEIRRTADAIDDFRSRFGAEIFALHGELSKEVQARALAPSNALKIVLSTNVAETSLTIDGITTVIDSGLHRQASFSPWSGIASLGLKPISQSSAIQRAGRAGRTGPGDCYRLYPKVDFEARPAHDTPELFRSDLSQTLLELGMLDLDPDALPWLEPPPASAIASALQTLKMLGAIDSTDRPMRLNAEGRRMAKIPAPPRLARLLLHAESGGVTEAGIRLAALLLDGRLQSLDALADVERGAGSERTVQQLQRAIGAKRGEGRTASSGALAEAALAAFPDRVARKRTTARGTELIFATGGSSMVGDAPVLHESDFFVVLDVEERRTPNRSGIQLRVRSLIPVAEEALLMLPLEERDTYEWNPQRKFVERVRRLALGQIAIEETRERGTDPELVAPVLLKALLGIDAEQLKQTALRDLPQLLTPIAAMEEIDITLARLTTTLGSAETAQVRATERILTLFGQVTGLEDLRATEWNVSLFAEDYALGETRAPRHLDLPSGRRARVFYSLERGPWVESRLQDFFGLTETPKLGPNKLPVTVHLLAPNGRAVQVTSDLSSFWKNAYPALRKELGRRYPRHAWPENPLIAIPAKHR